MVRNVEDLYGLQIGVVEYIKSKQGLLLVYLTLLFDFFKVLASSSQPIRCKIKNNRPNRFPALQAVCMFSF